jgi:hypothetical protein
VFGAASTAEAETAIEMRMVEAKIRALALERDFRPVRAASQVCRRSTK